MHFGTTSGMPQLRITLRDLVGFPAGSSELQVPVLEQWVREQFSFLLMVGNFKNRSTCSTIAPAHAGSFVQSNGGPPGGICQLGLVTGW